MTRRNSLRVSKLSLGLIAALAAAPVFAQSTSAGVGGVVLGSDGQPVTNAEVTIVHVESGTTSRVTTDANGRYNARGLRVGGPYEITITKAGSGTKTEDNVFLSLNQVNTVNAQLTGDVTTLATVTAVGVAGGSEVFSATKMGSGTSLDQRQIEALPSATGNIQDYIRLDPRVAFTDRASGSLSAGGMNPRYNKITIDGVSASDTFGLEGNSMPTQRQPVSMEAIEALDINLSSYDVTLSGAVGANINAVTKSGTNEFSGSVYGYYRDGDWFGKHPLTRADFSEFTEEKTYGATFGGPILRDRLFFFVNYEKSERGAPGPDLGNTPLTLNGDFDAADLAEVQSIARERWGFEPGEVVGGDGNTELEEYAIKLDWNINDFHRANIRYSKLEQSRVRPANSSSSSIALTSNWFNHDKTVESVVGQVFSDWTDTFSTEFKASYRDYAAIRVPPTTAPTIQVYFDDGNPTNQPNLGDFIRLGTERSSMGNALLTKTWDYFGAATWTVGDHDIKFGAEYSDNEIYNYFLQDAWGNYSFLGLDDFRNGIFFDYDLQYQTAPGSVPAEYSSRNLGLFIQDTWYVNQNLTLNFGLRADKPSSSPAPAYNEVFAGPRTVGANGRWTGGFGLDNSYTYSGDFIFQPRLGFNYTFDSDRPTQLRGGVGLFQGDAPQVWISNSYQSTGLNYVAYSNYRHCDYTGVLPNNVNSTCLTTPFNPDGLDPTIPPAASANRNVNVISPEFDLPSVWKANFAIDHELPWHGIVGSAELLLTSVKDGLFYRSLNVGPGFTGPDGRTLYWNPSVARFTGARHNNNSYFGDVFLLENTNKGGSQQLTLSLSKPFSVESDWAWSLGYTYTNADEVGALTSSTASSGYGGQYGFNINEAEATTSRHEIRDRFSAAVNWSHAFFGDYKTKVGMFYEGRSGRPYSYIFAGDANGDNRTFNDLFYVPSGPGDVKFGSLSATGAFTANPAMEAAFWEWLESQDGLQAYRGTYAPENGFRAGWVNTFDIRISQELPGFFEGHKSELWLDIMNVGNLINDDWGHILDYGFNGNVAAASLIGIHEGQYVYGYRSGTEFGQNNLAVPTDSDSQTNGISQWSVTVGFKYQF